MTVFIQNKKNEIMLFNKEVYQKPQISVFAVDVEALMENASGNAGTLEGSVPRRRLGSGVIPIINN